MLSKGKFVMTYEKALENIKEYLETTQYSASTILDNEYQNDTKSTFHRLLYNDRGEFNIMIHIEKETGIARYRIRYDCYKEFEKKITPKTNVIFQYLTTANNEYAEELCHAGIDDENEPYIEIRHNYNMFGLSVSNLEEFARICVERVWEDHFTILALIFNLGQYEENEEDDD